MDIQIDNTVRISDLITWGMVVLGFVVTFIKIHFRVGDHDKVLYDDNRELNVVTVGACSSSRRNCSKARNKEYMHIRGVVKGLSGQLKKLNQQFVTDQKIQNNRIVEARECLILVSSKMGKLCDNLGKGHD